MLRAGHRAASCTTAEPDRIHTSGGSSLATTPVRAGPTDADAERSRDSPRDATFASSDGTPKIQSTVSLKPGMSHRSFKTSSETSLIR